MIFLLALSTNVQALGAVDAAVDFAKEKNAELVALFVLDENVPAAIFDKLTDIGFIGEKPGEQLEEAVSAEYGRQAETVVAEVERLAKEKGVACRTSTVRGDFIEKTLEAVAGCAADTLIIVRARRSFVYRLLAGAGFDELVRRAPCEIKVFEA